MNLDGRPWRTVWADGSAVCLLDQNALPFSVAVHPCPTVAHTADAIRTMVVRGAGAIGATAAYGLAQAALLAPDSTFAANIAAASALLAATRPTAQNLFAGLAVVQAAITAEGDHPGRARQAAVAAARAFADDDAACCEAIGRHGAPLLTGGGVATHCNAGWLAFVDWGSALAPIYAAHRGGTRLHVWVDETRPRGQGARLTAFELGQEGVPHSLIVDGSLAAWMKRGEVQAMIVGSDRIAANGDVANKIGTYAAALVAHAHGVPFYVAAPTTTIDPDVAHGDLIPIEERSEEEVTWITGPTEDGTLTRVRWASPGVRARNLAFDVTPAHLVAGIITERGVVSASVEGIASVTRR